MTPIHEDGSLRITETERIILEQLDAGVDGFYINGATGEGPLLPASTRQEMAETAVALVKGRGAVINHVASANTMEALELARHAGRLGCDAISSVVPNFLFQFPEERVLDYYQRLVEAAGLPVIVYVNNLFQSNPCAFLEKAIKTEGIAGVKYTKTDYYEMYKIGKLNGGDINVINGPDQTLLCGLLMGADGGIGATYNIMPNRFVALHCAWRRGDIAAAREIQFAINPVIETLQYFGTIPAIKEYFRLRGIETGGAVYPGKTFTQTERNALRVALEKLDIL